MAIVVINDEKALDGQDILGGGGGGVSGDLGTAAAADVGDFATAAQGGLADSALQPGDVVNALDSTATDAPLSAAQGKVLNDAITPLVATDARLTGATNILISQFNGGF